MPELLFLGIIVRPYSYSFHDTIAMTLPRPVPSDLGREIVGRLTNDDSWGYHHDTPAATEPTALAALACLALGETDRAVVAMNRLAAIQAADGSLGVSAEQQTPRWPTSLAVLAWTAYEQAAEENSLPPSSEMPAFTDNIRRGVKSILTIKGKKGEADGQVGHNTKLVAWPWVEGTHSWIEPTAMHVLALRATGHGQHVRVAQATRLMIDRILPDGGLNYGNTFVLGQQLRPHTQPTGLTLLALAKDDRSGGPIRKTTRYLQSALSSQTTTLSLSYGLLGLAAHGVFPKSADDWIRAAYHRTMARDRSPYKLALLALAALNENSPLIALPRKVTV